MKEKNNVEKKIEQIEKYYKKNKLLYDIYFIKQSNVTSFFFNSLKKPTS